MARKELKNKSSKLEKRDSELQAASQGLKTANWLAKGIKSALDHERSVFQSMKDGLLRQLELALTDKAEAEKQADEEIEAAKGGQGLQAYEVP